MDIPDKYKANWLDTLDGRTAVAQEMRHRYQQFTADLGGDDRLSYGQRSLVSRALWLEYWLQEQERQMATGTEIDMGKWTQAVNSLQGILTKLGLKRQAREVSLTDYVNGASK